MRAHAIALMAGFAERTGITGRAPQRRYLWTDAFAVCNFLGLYRQTGNAADLELARQLVDRVHHTLGRHRADDRRSGWISGLPEHEGEAHPTLGGLRIGKPLPERPAGQPADERLEWERDGQYFHYLTKWIHALDQLARATHATQPRRWARELADTAHRRFVHGAPPGRIFWKMSIDLSRPQIASMGQHDALDGFVTCSELMRATFADAPDLRAAQRAYAAMIERGALATADPLGLGGLLVDAYHLDRLRVDPSLVHALLSAAEVGLARCTDGPELYAPAAHRLGFRELGLALGLAALARLDRSTTARFEPYLPLRDEIPAFWLRPEHRATRTWAEHQDINDVMLATCLEPDGFLTLFEISAD